MVVFSDTDGGVGFSLCGCIQLFAVKAVNPPSFAIMWMLVVLAVFVASLVVFSGVLYKLRRDMRLLDD